MKKMTKRERVEAVLNFEEPDRIPIYDLLYNDKAISYYAGKKLTVENGPEVVPKAIGRALDMTRSIAFPQKPRIEEVSEIDRHGFVLQFERWTNWIKKRPFETVDGLRKWAEKEIKRLDKYKPTKEEINTFRKHFLELQKKIGDTVQLLTCSSVGLDSGAYIPAGLDLFIYLYAEDPCLVSEWLEAYNLAEIRRVHAIADYKLSPVTLVYSDIAFKDKLIFSPKFLKDEFYFRLERLVKAYHEHNIKCLFHSDGYLMDILPDLIETDVDGLNPIETAAGMNLKKIKNLYGDKIFLAGGIDVSELMPYGTTKEVKKAVIQVIKDAAQGSGYFLGSTTELHNVIPGENIVTMIETTKKFGKYPLKL